MHDSGTERWNLCNQNGDTVIRSIDLVMTCQSFAILIAQTMALDDRKCSVLLKFMFDTSGVFEPKGIKDIYYLLKNYDTERYSFENPSTAVRIIWDYRNGIEQEACDKLFVELSNSEIPFRIVSWGDNLNKEIANDEPTILYITEEAFCSQSIAHFYEKMRQHGFQNVCAVFDDESQFLSLAGEPQFPSTGLAHWSNRNAAEKVRFIYTWYRQQQYKREGVDTYVLGVSYSHTLVAGKERPAVTALKKIIEGLNSIFGEYNIVFDGNQVFKDMFDRNGAVQESLELYLKCSYYIILDDSHYCDGENCPREASVIQEQVKAHQEVYKQHVWFLRPKNDSGSILFNKEEDFSIKMDCSEKNIQEIVETISRVVVTDGFSGR